MAPFTAVTSEPASATRTPAWPPFPIPPKPVREMGPLPIVRTDPPSVTETPSPPAPPRERGPRQRLRPDPRGVPEPPAPRAPRRAAAGRAPPGFVTAELAFVTSTPSFPSPPAPPEPVRVTAAGPSAITDPPD